MKRTDGSENSTEADQAATARRVGEGSGDATVAGKPSAIETAARERATTLPSYELGELLGRGGMGEVVLAEDREIGRQVAIKRMRGDAPSDAQVSRFLREAKIQARLDHPAIVPVHELGRDATGRPYFTMKRLSGTTLSQVIKTRRDTQQKLLRAFVDVCLAIEFAHARGFIHRDLKPSNVMLGEYGEVYVIDWGLARSIHEPEPESRDGGDSLGGETQAGAVMGTPGYMSPEQLRADAVGPPTDVYGLGAILFEILTGTPVHPRGEAAIQSTLVGGRLSPAASSARAIPPELDELCARALAERPEDRPSARTLADGVQQFLDGDRDLERRRGLAAELLVRARADAESDDPARRGSAMQAAGRALALDPESDAAGALVGKLMLEPPRAMPPQLAKRLEETDFDHAVVQARVAILTLTAYFLFVPIHLWMGVRDWLAFVVIYGAAGMCIGCAWLLSRHRGFPPLVAAALNALLLIALTRVTTPFLIAPTLIVVAAISFAMFPRLHDRAPTVIAIFVGALITPLVLEYTGVWRSTWDIVGGRFVAEPSAVAFDGTPAIVFLVTVNVAILFVVPMFVRELAVSQRKGRRQLEIQAWHLAQLIPTPARD